MSKAEQADSIDLMLGIGFCFIVVTLCLIFCML